MTRRLILILIAALLVGALLAPAAPMTQTAQAQRPDAPDYAQRGPHAVGTREFAIDAGDTEGTREPLTGTLWYPALNPDAAEESVIYQVAAFMLEGHALRDAAPDVAGGPYPVVVFSHGSGGLRLQSLFLTEHLASYGFVVVAVDHPGNTTLDTLTNAAGFGEALVRNFGTRPLDLLRAIAFMDDLAASDDPLAPALDMARLAVMGHSFGGYTALALAGARLDYGAKEAICAEGSDWRYVPDGIPAPGFDDTFDLHDSCDVWRETEPLIAELRGLDSVPDGLWPATSDPRIDAMVLMAPALGTNYGAAGLAEVTVPALIIVGSDDSATVPTVDAYPIHRHIGSQQKTLAVLHNAGHYIFVDECAPIVINFGLYDMCSDPVWDMDRAHDITNQLVTAFLLSQLGDDAGVAADAAAALEPDAVDFRAVSYLRSE